MMDSDGSVLLLYISTLSKSRRNHRALDIIPSLPRFRVLVFWCRFHMFHVLVFMAATRPTSRITQQILDKIEDSMCCIVFCFLFTCKKLIPPSHLGS